MITSRLQARALLSFCTLYSIAPVYCQIRVDPDRVQGLRAQLMQSKSMLNRIPRNQRAMLSGATQNLLQLANNFDKAVDGLEDAPATLGTPGNSTVAASNVEATPAIGIAPVSNPVPDFLFSVMGGFTQSETSTSWCRSSVVVGFNDSGSVFESLLFGSGGISLTGAAFSTNGGSSFRDTGFINPGPNPVNLLAGDPVVNCSGPNKFFYSQIFQTGTLTPLHLLAGVALSRSTDGGASWADPIAAVAKDSGSHFLDKPWSTVDPTNSSRIFVTYTDFDLSGAVCGFSKTGAPIERIAIELVSSLNAGTTWSTPVVLEEDCNTAPAFPLVQGSQVIVDSRGRVYVAWLAFPSGTASAIRQLRIAQSTDNGASFAKFVPVSTVVAAGNGHGLGYIQGGIRNSEFPSLAVDRSGRQTDGYLYIAWNDGRNLRVQDFEAPTGRYGYSDILVSRSNDGGKTWSSPNRVNNDPVALPNGRGVDHFQPGVAVDNTGTVGICWYDRRADPANFLIGRFCGLSVDTANTWFNIAAAPFSWPPFHGVDLLLNSFYLGDYDVVATDFMRTSPGFLGGYASVTTLNVPVPNQDVFLFRFP